MGEGRAHAASNGGVALNLSVSAKVHLGVAALITCRHLPPRRAMPPTLRWNCGWAHGESLRLVIFAYLSSAMEHRGIRRPGNARGVHRPRS